MSRFCILFILILLAGCSSIAGRVEGWPAMEVNIHESHLLEINQKCYAYLPVAYKLAGALSFGCSIYDLNKNTCDIYLAAGTPDFIVQHEMAHCTGGTMAIMIYKSHLIDGLMPMKKWAANQPMSPLA